MSASTGRFGVEPILAVLNEHGIGIARSTYYAHQARGFGPSSQDIDDAYAANELFDLWVRNRRVYGRRKLEASRLDDNHGMLCFPTDFRALWLGYLDSNQEQLKAIGNS